MADRLHRINQAIRGVLSDAVGDLSDPRIGFVTFTGVDVTRDFRHARVYVSVLGGEDEAKDTIDALRASHGILQRAIAREVQIKNTPVLEFVLDDSVDTAFRVSDLLRDDEGVGE
jgi:ribosome-binding factor A